MRKFRDLMANEELYFRRADKFGKDPNEGIPQDDWLRAVLNLRRFIQEDEVELNDHKGNLSQFRESSYISFWHVFEGEDPEMWKDFSPFGVAVCSRYDLLKNALSLFLDDLHLGLTEYKPPTRYNVFNFIFSKGSRFAGEKELRVVLTCSDPVGANNRHYDKNNFPHDRPLKSNRLHKWVADGKRRRIALSPLLTGIVLSPWASSKAHKEVELWATLKKLNGAVRRSALKTKTLPTLRELAAVKGSREP